MAESSLINVGELSKPATVLIEKISDAVGGVFKPYQIVRVAKAEAEAERIQAEAQLAITDLQRRAMHRFLEEEAKRQANIENITSQALPHLNVDASPENVADDWIANFFDKCRIVSDSDMQKLWAHVLAGEANTPGAFSKRTIGLLADLDKHDAELFRQLCGFAWMILGPAVLVFSKDSPHYNAHGVNFGTLSHLESLGLIQFNAITTFRRTRLPKTLRVHYYGRPLVLTFPNDSDNNLELGEVLLTSVGRELATVCDSRPIEGCFDFVRERWMAHGLCLNGGDGDLPASSPDIEASSD